MREEEIGAGKKHRYKKGKLMKHARSASL